MPKPKVGKTKNGELMHYSTGAVIEQDGKYLLIDRAIPPLGFAGVAGHVDEGETPEESLVREIKEESGLEALNYELIFEEELDWNWCSKGVQSHHWYLFRCVVSGEIKQNIKETKSIGWYTKEEIRNLKLEPIWEYWFKKLEII